MSEDTFNLFLRHMYGCKVEVMEVAKFSTLVELHSIASQFGQVELEKDVKERLRWLLNMETKGPSSLVELNMLLTKHKVEWLLPLVEEKAKAIEVGEAELDGLLEIVNRDGPHAEVRIRLIVCTFCIFEVIMFWIFLITWDPSKSSSIRIYLPVDTFNF